MRRRCVRLTAGALLLGIALLSGCFSVKTQNEVAVQPIHITVDVNVHVQQELTKFFEEIDNKK
jgi:hypothetical protein